MSENESTPIDPEALDAAREQADDFESFLRPLEVPTRDGGVFKVPHPGMLDDDASEAYNEMRWTFNQCDRVTEDVPETTITLKDGTTTTMAAHTVVGGFIDPYQKDGERIRPSYNIQMAQCLLGPEKYEEFKSAGCKSNDLAIALNKRAEEMRNRTVDDSKSVDGAVVPEAVAETD
ncbi:hypothetical protein [Mycolicibacterium llatzerense]|uniref:hypothetical protein n=1 Tax=Mycolicibacterium llatzerense TaxID=280871 RepID=UPI0021B5F401|nr:hypothetical protein [Mycolicibacterium llatzerense]MCT7366506.1 hypothetical protein [Mycolicibacterium llatzerense]